MDTYKHKGLRKKLIAVLQEKGIQSAKVLAAIDAIPRHLFMDNAFVNFAYQDKAFPIGSDQTISQPFTVAFQSELLNVNPKDKVLEIGTGSGYQTCVLVELGAKVFSIERHRSLHRNSKALLERLNYQAKVFFGDGYKGLPTYAPFDKIIITAAAPYIPEDLKSQLKIGGVLVIPVGGDAGQQMLRITRLSEEEFKEEKFGDFSFVPMLKDKSFSS